jgi:phosphoglycerate dehydrogenase-like enzyme
MSTSQRVIFITGRQPDERQMERLRKAAPDAEIRVFDNRAEMEGQIEEAEIVAGGVRPEALACAERLRWVHSWAAGPDTQLYPEFVASPITLTSSKGNGAIPLAEHAIMLMLMLNRNALRWIRAQDDHRWDRFTHGELTGLTCGIIGLGHSGQDLTAKARAFHMRVIGVRRTSTHSDLVDELYPLARLHDFLGASDFVIVTAPLTPETAGMLGEAEFRAMKRSAYYICFSRGGIADDAALLRALNEGWIAGARLDAHSEEPLPPDSPFWTAPNTIVTLKLTRFHGDPG